jgi:hypothetical protein
MKKWIVNGTSMVVEAETAEEAVDRAQDSSGWHWEATEVLKEGAQKTWTFVGHWENDRIEVEYILDGEVQDTREDTGYWEQGLWAASGTGNTVKEAQANAVAEYEAEYNDGEES